MIYEPGFYKFLIFLAYLFIEAHQFFIFHFLFSAARGLQLVRMLSRA